MYIRNVRFWDGDRGDLFCYGEGEIDGSYFIAIPGVIDGHVHFRTPGAEHKEDWKTAATGAVKGGVTSVFDMPNTSPFVDSLEIGVMKEEIVKEQLSTVNIPLRYKFYLGVSSNNLPKVEVIQDHLDLFCGIKIFMGSSTGVRGGEVNLDAVFRLAAEYDVVIAVHAEDEIILQRAAKAHASDSDWHPSFHSLLRPPEAAYKAVERVLDLSAKHGTKLYILHIGTEREVELIYKAKKSGISVYAEAALPHLFFDITDYGIHGDLIKVNPPLRNPGDREALWDALRTGKIDAVGSDHAPHLKEEKLVGGKKAPSGIPGVQFLLPLLLNAVHENKLTLETLVQITSSNLSRIFSLSTTEDWVIIKEDLEKQIIDKDIASKCGWSPYVGRTLVGWPIYTILKGKLYSAGGRENSFESL